MLNTYKNEKYVGLIHNSFATCPEGTLYFYRGRGKRPYLITRKSDEARIRRERLSSLFGVALIAALALVHAQYGDSLNAFVQMTGLRLDLAHAWWVYPPLLAGIYLWRSIRIGAVVMELPLYDDES